MKHNIILILIVLASNVGKSQIAPIAAYSFKDCSISDNSTNQYDLTLTGDKVCDCGLIDEALLLNGTGNEVSLPDTLRDLFYGDFTIDFYANLSEVFVPTALFSVQTDCSLDSSIYLRYLPESREVLLEVSESPGDYYALKGKVNQTCWTRITFSRDKLNYRLFIDNVNVALSQVEKEIPPGKNSKIMIGSSPCVLERDVRFGGQLDEFKIYDESLSERDLFNNYLFPDQIVTPDTTLFVGESIQLVVGESCFDDFYWDQTSSIEDPNVLDIVVKPEVTSTYTLTIEDNGCLTKDEITVFVANKEDQSCNKLLLPRAFTPNGDRLNDDYGISNTFLVDKINEFNIYDRWGGKVFETFEKQQKWDGTKNGRDLAGGAYTYWISYTCENKTYTKSGNFVMLK